MYHHEVTLSHQGHNGSDGQSAAMENWIDPRQLCRDRQVYLSDIGKRLVLR